MKYLFALYFIVLPIKIRGQVKQLVKETLDSMALSGWPTPIFDKISSNGELAVYNVLYPSNNTIETVVKGTNNNFKETLTQVIDISISDDSKYIIFLKSNDSLGIIRSEDKLYRYIASVSSFKLIQNQSSKWLIYCLKDSQQTLYWIDLSSGIVKQTIPNILNYFSDERGLFLFFLVQEPSGNGAKLGRLNLSDGKHEIIWKGQSAYNFIFNKKENVLGFISLQGQETAPIKSVYTCSVGQHVATKVTTSPISIENMLYNIDRLQQFSNNDSLLFFSLKEIQQQPIQNEDIKLDLWSYNDKKIISAQIKEISKSLSYLGVCNLYTSKTIKLENKNDHAIGISEGYPNNNFILISSISNIENEWNWNKYAKSSVYFCTVNGGRKLIDSGLNPNIALNYKLSPRGDYIIYYDPKSKNYFSYSLLNYNRVNLTRHIKTTWTSYKQDDIPSTAYLPIGYAGWTEDNKILVYSQNDIFSIDPENKSTTICLTNYLGQRNDICLRFAITSNSLKSNDLKSRILSAFDHKTKNDGYYLLSFKPNEDPEKLIQSPHIYNGFLESDRVDFFQPLFAKDSNIFVVRRMSAEESPNYFWTTDFKKFNPITRIHPEEKYNLLTTELITYKQTIGKNKRATGILYKPQNLDTTKKHPLIFFYYEKMSDALNAFLYPDYYSGPINIPFLVSQGYLVFTPDFHYAISSPGESVVKLVKSAVKSLSNKPYIDINKMGLQGHSRGGWETNYIISHCNLFSAAVSACGLTNYSSLYLGVREFNTGTTRYSGFETGAQRMGGTIWEKRKSYIENSPIFYADKIKTPILLMSNKKDSDIPFYQGVEFFNALRRLGKRAWMLQYEEGGHVIGGKEAKDYTRRVNQFFNHYLKGDKAPIWMTNGIPVYMKNIEKAFELNNNNITPLPNPLNEK